MALRKGWMQFTPSMRTTSPLSPMASSRFSVVHSVTPLPTTLVSFRAYATSEPQAAEGGNTPAPSLDEMKSELQATEQRARALREAIATYRDTGKKNVLVLGAGRSSGVCIEYLLNQAKTNGWHIKVGDDNEDWARDKVRDDPSGSTFRFDANSAEQRDAEVQKADLVVSLLPAHMHYLVAKDCVRHGVNMITASYASPAMRELSQQAEANNVLLMMECGVDPGLDHMGVWRVLTRLRAEGSDLNTFQSFTGGLVAPESDDNPWNYKFTWNPRNVVLAGQGVSKFLHNGKYKYIPYHQVFKRYEDIHVEGHGQFEGYANRDSLHYRDLYQLHSCPTVFRGTLRRPGFCAAWDVFVRLGMTDDTYVMENCETMTHRDFINSFLMWRAHDSVELKVAYTMGLSVDSDVMKRLKWLGIFEDRIIGIKKATPAQILQHILEKKWSLSPGDKDMIVMWNQFVFDTVKGRRREIVASLVAKGDGTDKGTAMAKTVGLPLAIVAKLILQGKAVIINAKRPTASVKAKPKIV
eukprot:TRINITY_DN2477_c0_g1_i4.p1 TRINITY_DN2477_c0_g1~~TRINITY_DN2477_c0_g1_i4.p1  ORF type:complete len:524 (+),score=89.40 TRINITY_DN2477_c0_g1_i4:38-1609(+)